MAARLLFVPMRLKSTRWFLLRTWFNSSAGRSPMFNKTTSILPSLLTSTKAPPRQAPLMVVVAKVNAHGAQFLAVCAQGHAGKKASLLKGTVVLVVIKEIRPGIVGHVKIGPAIVVVVAPYDTQAIAVSRIVNPGFL